MSFYLSEDSETLHNAIKNANTSNIIMVAAAREENSVANYPAAYIEVVSFGATDKNAPLSSLASNKKVDFIAPSVDIYSTFKNAS